MGLTRRGHGDSDYPETGYDADTLTKDLRQFLDALGIDQVILAGHSLAYIELSGFASNYPGRVRKLVFLDAAYDCHTPEYKAVYSKNPVPGMIPPWPAENPGTIAAYAATVTRLFPSLAVIWGEAMEDNLKHSIKEFPDGGWVDKMPDAINHAIRETVDSYKAPYTKIQAPLLSIFAIRDGSDYLSSEYMSADQKAQVLDYFKTILTPYVQQYIQQFRRAVPHARVFVIPDGHHYCFIKQEEPVFNEMKMFLLDLPV